MLNLLPFIIIFLHNTGFHTTVSNLLQTCAKLHKSLLLNHSKIRITKSLGSRLKPCPGLGITFLITLLLLLLLLQCGCNESCCPDGGDGVTNV